MSSILKIKKPSQHTLKWAEKEAAEAGYDVLTVKRTKSFSSLGKYIEQDAIKSLAPAILVHAMHVLKDSIDYCTTALSQKEVELTPAESEKILGRLSNLVAQQISLAEKMQSAAVLAGKTSPKQLALRPSFSPHATVTPVNVNIGIKSDGNIRVQDASEGS